MTFYIFESSDDKLRFLDENYMNNWWENDLLSVCLLFSVFILLIVIPENAWFFASFFQNYFYGYCSFDAAKEKKNGKCSCSSYTRAILVKLSLILIEFLKVSTWITLCKSKDSFKDITNSCLVLFDIIWGVYTCALLPKRRCLKIFYLLMLFDA